MKKRILSALLCAALLTTGAFAAPAETVEVPVAELPVLQNTAVGEYATVTEFAAKSGQYSTLSVQSDSYDALELHFSADTLLMDTQTGYCVSEQDIQKGDHVFVYYDEAVAESDPPQSHAQAVLVNLDDAHAPAHLLTAESVIRNEDGSSTVLCENGGTLVTLPAEMDIRPLATKNAVRVEEIRVGTRFFAWYDMVALSLPGQATATKAVLPPQTDSAFPIVVEGDMTLPDNGRMENGVAMLPLRSAAEALGYTVTWDQREKAASLTNGTVQTTVRMGEDSYHVTTAPSQGFVVTKAMAELGAAAYNENGKSWAPAELFVLLGDTVSLQGGALLLGQIENGSASAEQLPNPVEDADAAALAALGLPITAPAAAQNAAYSVIDQTLAQVTFTLDGAEYTYRASKQQGDIAGVYEEFEDEAMGISVDYADGATTVTVKTTVSGGRLATWQNGEIQCSLYTASTVSDERIGLLVTELAAQTMTRE